MSEAIDRVVAQGEAEEARLKAEGRVEQRKEAAELKDAGNAAFTAKDFDKACDLYSEALELDHGANLTARSDAPEHALTGVLFANRAAALLKLERPAEAETDCRRALQRAASAELLARCALACLAQGGEDKVADAFGCVCEGLMLEPNHAVSRKALRRSERARRRLLRPDGDCLAKLKSRIKRRGDGGLRAGLQKDAAPLGSDDDAASSNGKGDDDDDDASVVESAAAAPAKAEAPKQPRARKPASKLKKKAPIGGQGTAGAGAAPMTATLRAAIAPGAAAGGRRRRCPARADAYAAPRLALADGAVLAAGAGAGGADDCFANCGAARRSRGSKRSAAATSARCRRRRRAASTGSPRPGASRRPAGGRRACGSPRAPARAPRLRRGSCAVADLSPDGAAEVVLAGAPRRDRPAATGAAVRALAWCPAADACLALANESGHVQVWSLRDAAFPLWEDRFSDRCGSLGLAWHPSGACLLSGGAVPGNFSGAVLRLDVSKAPDEKRRSTVAYRHAEGTAVLDLDALLVPAAGGDRVELVLASAGGDGALAAASAGAAGRLPAAPSTRSEAAAPPAAAEAAADGGTVDGAVLAAPAPPRPPRWRRRRAAAAAPRRGRPGLLDDRDVAVCSARLGAGDALGYVVSAAACGLLRLQKVTGEPGDDETVDEPEPEPPKKPKAKEAPKKPRGRPKKAEDAAGDGDAAPKKRAAASGAAPPPPTRRRTSSASKRRSAPVEEEDAEEEDAEDAPEDAPAPKKLRRRKQPPPRREPPRQEAAAGREAPLPEDGQPRAEEAARPPAEAPAARGARRRPRPEEAAPARRAGERRAARRGGRAAGQAGPAEEARGPARRRRDMPPPPPTTTTPRRRRSEQAKRACPQVAPAPLCKL
ncbi:hypothetical protein JL721_1319 [Aureococcus anophagefferens]|nr:hypothetical protein JL721_1319 [Aureococcus anophagefferens]